MEYKKNIIFIAAVAFCIVFSGNIYNSIQSYKYRNLCDQYREQLIATEEANREFTDRIGRITEIVGRIKEVEDCCGSFDYNKYYSYWDSYYGIE